MKKLTDYFIPNVNNRISRYAEKIKQFPKRNYHPDSKEGGKLFDMYVELLKIDPKKINSEETREKHRALCNELSTKLPLIVVLK